jgi:hypothetical protein
MAPTVTPKKEVFEGATLVLKTSDVMAFVLQMNAGPALSRTVWEV